MASLLDDGKFAEMLRNYTGRVTNELMLSTKKGKPDFEIEASGLDEKFNPLEWIKNFKAKEMKMGLYEVAIVKTVSKDEADRGVSEELLLAPTPVLAESKEAAIVAATMSSKAELKGIDPQRVKVLVRPFG